METSVYLCSAPSFTLTPAILYSLLDGLAGSCVKYSKCGHRVDLFSGTILSGFVPASFSEVRWRIVSVYACTLIPRCLSRALFNSVRQALL